MFRKTFQEEPDLIAVACWKEETKEMCFQQPWSPPYGLRGLKDSCTRQSFRQRLEKLLAKMSSAFRMIVGPAGSRIFQDSVERCTMSL